ncbi:unnamed protein product [Boreogadus saida]
MDPLTDGTPPGPDETVHLSIAQHFDTTYTLVAGEAKTTRRKCGARPLEAQRGHHSTLTSCGHAAVIETRWCHRSVVSSSSQHTDVNAVGSSKCKPVC